MYTTLKEANIRTCYFYDSDCFKEAKKIKPVGIIVHSTGANNPWLKRYVQPTDKNTNKSSILYDIGVNKYSNSWNRPGLDVCVHAFIGKNIAGTVEAYQVLPWARACWGCGSGKNGSYNYAPHGHIQFEIQEDDLKDEKYFWDTIIQAAKVCAYLCQKYNLSVDSIIGHKDAADAGYASNHGDPYHWWKRYGYTMEKFRQKVTQYINVKPQPEPEPEPEPSPDPEPAPEPSGPKAGQPIKLNREPLYISAYSNVPVGSATGNYYYWSSEVINGKIRITCRLKYVGAKGQVTGWIKI